MTVYLDEVFVINGFVDYLLLVVAGNLTATPLRRRRILLAGALGGVYGGVCLLPGWGFLQGFGWELVVAMLLCMVSFGAGRGLLRQTLVLFLLTAAFSGVVLLLTELFSAPAALVAGRVYYPLTVGTLVLTAGGAYGIFSWALGRLSHQGGDVAPVKVSMGAAQVLITALRDTGNTLKDPITGQQVLVLSPELLGRLLPGVDRALLERPQELFWQLQQKQPELLPRLLPFKTIGTSHGMLVALRPTAVVVEGKQENLLVAFSPARISDGGGYQALLGGKTG